MDNTKLICSNYRTLFEIMLNAMFLQITMQFNTVNCQFNIFTYFKLAHAKVKIYNFAYGKLPVGPHKHIPTQIILN